MKNFGEIIEAFQKNGYKVDLVKPALQLAIAKPEEILQFSKEAIKLFPDRAHTFQTQTLSYLPMEDWPDLIKFALESLVENLGNESAADVISYASLQCVELLHPHYQLIFALQPNCLNYTENWPWRFNLAGVKFLQEVVLSEAISIEDRKRACEALFETRLPSALQWVCDSADKDLLGDHNYWLAHAGFEMRDGHLRRLHSQSPLHLAFPEELKAIGGVMNLDYQHPTWQTDDFERHGAGIVGGITQGSCAVCGGALRNLLTLESIPASLGVTQVLRLVVAACLSCFGKCSWEVFYRHDENGNPQCLASPQELPADFEPESAIKELRVDLVYAGVRWQFQDWGMSNGRENLFRLGGSPSWIQDNEFLKCPSCLETMCFILQLDSFLPREKSGDECWWGSGGICYVFWCDNCKISGLNMQFT